MNRLEIAFPIAALAVVALALTIPFAVAAPADDGETESFDLDLDRAVEPPDVADERSATIDDRQFESASAAIDAAEPGDTVVLEGTFEERLVLTTENVTVRSGPDGAAIDGGGEDSVVTVAAENVTVEGLWLHNSGDRVDEEDGAVFVDGDRATLTDLHVTDTAFGVWINGADDVTVADSRIEGREDVYPRVDRGNGIHLWETEGTVIRNNEITNVRDGIYYSWTEDVVAEENAMWNNRYGVHYMYSNDNRLEGNLAVDNDVGYALMVSERLTVANNTAVRNTGSSGHGILIKDVERSTVRGNVVVENGNGLYVYNAQDNRLAENLLLRNEVGIHATAGTDGQEVVGNSVIDNDDAVVTTTRSVAVWNGTDRGNYWSDARPIDLDGDGTSEVHHRPAGMVEHLVRENPQAAVFADSPAFDAVRLAESSFPVVESPGIVDRQPLADSPHDWREYANHR